MRGANGARGGRPGAAAALAAVLLIAAAAGAAAQPRAMPKKASETCGSIGQKCCSECPPDTPPEGERRAAGRWATSAGRLVGGACAAGYCGRALNARRWAEGGMRLSATRTSTFIRGCRTRGARVHSRARPRRNRRARAECDQWSCGDGAQCYMFASEAGVPPDGESRSRALPGLSRVLMRDALMLHPIMCIATHAHALAHIPHTRSTYHTRAHARTKHICARTHTKPIHTGCASLLDRRRRLPHDVPGHANGLRQRGERLPPQPPPTTIPHPPRPLRS